MTPHPKPPPPTTSIGEKQTIQARHGVATFVPKGHMIKIINTYGKQVVDTWAFALNAPPEDGDIHKEEGKEEESPKKAKKAPEKKAAEAGPSGVVEKAKDSASEVAKEGQKVTEKTTDAVSDAGTDLAEGAQKTSENVTEKVPDGAKKGWSSYLPTVRRGTAKAPDAKAQKGESSKEAEGEEAMAKSWSSYLPSLGGGKESGDNTNSQSKGWSSYIPSGVGFSSYMPPKGTLSGFAHTHARDPTKSYAEQLFDFSKTPVGAAGLSGRSKSLRNIT
jgi:hypothetical protein